MRHEERVVASIIDEFGVLGVYLAAPVISFALFVFSFWKPATVIWLIRTGLDALEAEGVDKQR